MNSNTRFIPLNIKMQLTIVLTAYMFFASVFGYVHRFLITPDGISYLRMAEYIAEGNFQYSITGYWSPLISWCIAPFLLFGIDGLTALRIVNGLWGMPLIVSVWLLASRFSISDDVRFAAVLIASLIAANWSSKVVNPSIILMTLIFYYLFVVTNPSIIERKGIAFLCGVIGGLAYLSKHYAFPFFWAHYPLMLILMAFFHDKRISINKIIVPLAIGLTGFLIISSPWIYLVSSKYQQFTISSSGRAVRSISGPIQHTTKHRSFSGLHKPDNDYAIHTWEDPTGMDNETWSPFENKKYFMHQIKLCLNNITFIIKYFISNSFLLGLIAICYLPFAFLRYHHSPDRRFLYGWSFVTVSIYCAGYVLSWAQQERYFYPVMMFSLLLSFHFINELKVKFYSNEQKYVHKWKKYLILCLFVVLALSFTKASAGRFLWSVTTKIRTVNVNHNKELADEILTVDFPGPYAVVNSSGRAAHDLYWAYYVKKQLLGRPLSNDIEGITDELKAAKGNSLIVFNNPAIVKDLELSDKYIHKSSLRNDEVNIFTFKKNS